MAAVQGKKALLTGAFFIAWLLAAPLHAEECQAPGPGQAVTSRLVIDGDTLELSDRRRVRLIGIDTPEIGRRGEPSQPFAQAARKRLEQLVRQPGLRLHVGEQQQDRYGRTLAHLYGPGGQNIEAQLLSEGLGFALAVPPNSALIDCHLAAEQQARTARRGLWRNSPVQPAAQISTGGFALVSGRVMSVNEVGGYLWLELDGPLVLRIGQDKRKLFSSGSPASWRGRHLEARGWVIDRRGQRGLKQGHKPFMLPLRHPAMLELK
ncbi:MAG TPA: thermonuclease family protein [Alcanivorax sp.]|jgi:endonuclease YncB( thermonuclease family)|nr:thermonuclease family protein [Alcanivorax sp.]|tara:strand:+ start:82 stop:873 length:792 start_codon:yes stop_codon:yes gene_type:complete